MRRIWATTSVPGQGELSCQIGYRQSGLLTSCPSNLANLSLRPQDGFPRQWAGLRQLLQGESLLGHGEPGVHQSPATSSDASWAGALGDRGGDVGKYMVFLENSPSGSCLLGCVQVCGCGVCMSINVYDSLCCVMCVWCVHVWSVRCACVYVYDSLCWP